MITTSLLLLIHIHIVQVGWLDLLGFFSLTSSADLNISHVGLRRWLVNGELLCSRVSSMSCKDFSNLIFGSFSYCSPNLGFLLQQRGHLSFFLKKY